MPQPKTKPYSKPTAEELIERVAAVRRLLESGQRDGQIKQLISVNYGCSPRTVERYLRRARDDMRAETGKPKEEHRNDSYHLYQSIVRDLSLPAATRLQAQRQIDKLLGLNVPIPQRVNQVNLHAQVDMPPVMSAEELGEMTEEQLIAYEERCREWSEKARLLEAS